MTRRKPKIEGIFKEKKVVDCKRNKDGIIEILPAIKGSAHFIQEFKIGIVKYLTLNYN